MRTKKNKSRILGLWMICCLIVITGCRPNRPVTEPTSIAISGDSFTMEQTAAVETIQEIPTLENFISGTIDSEESEKRPKFMPGELVDYIAQTGDTLPALAARFNTSESEIRQANSFIPNDATTLPSGMPMEIPIYYRSQWGSALQILPDALFPNGPAQVGFSARAFVDRQPGWFKYFTVYTGDENRRGGEIIDYVSTTYSVSPRLLLALLEYRTGALSQTRIPERINESAVFGFPGVNSKQISAQLNKLSNFLNEVYYEYREGRMIEYQLLDGSLYRIDPWQNAATVALQHYFALILPPAEFFFAISADGFQKTYTQLFGAFPDEINSIPGSLMQPAFRLPFADDKSWAYTGGPHAAWGDAPPYAAVDFAPPSTVSGCVYSDEWVVAPAEGVIARTGNGIAVLDLDGDGDERTGWNIFFLHLLTTSIPPLGTHLNQGQPIGHPSCDGGTSTGTHVHLARKYNGEWMSAGGIIPFEFDNWKVENGAGPYRGFMRRYSSIVIANEAADYRSLIHIGPPLVPTQTPTPKPRN